MKLLISLIALILFSAVSSANNAYPSYYDSQYTTRASLSTISKEAALSGNFKHICITETGYAGCYDAIADSTAAVDGVTVLAFSDAPTIGRWVLGLSSSAVIHITSMSDLQSMTVANMRAHPTVILDAFYAGGLTGWATYEYRTLAQLQADAAATTPNAGSIVKPYGQSDCSQGCMVLTSATGTATPEMFGAKGAFYSLSASVSSGSTTITADDLPCTAGYAATHPVFLFYKAGTKPAGGRPNTLSGTVTGCSGTSFTVSAAASQTINHGGPFYVGFDDAAAINAAMQASNLGASVVFDLPAYITSSQLVIGSTTNRNQASTVHSPNHSRIASMISNHTTDAVVVNGYVPYSGAPYYQEAAFIDGLTFDAMNSGRYGVAVVNANSPVFQNIKIVNSYSSCLARLPTVALPGDGYINLRISSCGHHAIYTFVPNAVFANELSIHNFWIDTWGENSVLLGINASTQANQLGAGIYTLAIGQFSTGTAGAGMHFSGTEEFAAHAEVAAGYGSAVNPATIMFGDGSKAHVIEGAGAPSTNYYDRFQMAPGSNYEVGASGGYIVGAESAGEYLYGLSIPFASIDASYSAIADANVPVVGVDLTLANASFTPVHQSLQTSPGASLGGVGGDPTSQSVNYTDQKLICQGDICNLWLAADNITFSGGSGGAIWRLSTLAVPPVATTSCAIGNWSGITLDSGYTNLTAEISGATLYLLEVGSTKTTQSLPLMGVGASAAIALHCTYRFR